jgi:prolyl oligopeptidase
MGAIVDGAGPAATGRGGGSAGTEVQDPYLWLEQVTGDRALSWVEQSNSQTLTTLAGTPLFGSLRDEIREVLDDDRRVPSVVRRGSHLYNFWQDAQHPRGLWRRTTLEEYRAADPGWEVLLDLDRLAAAEDENWVWAGATFLAPAWSHCLVSLSRGGSDAAVEREFDPQARAFVSDGFVVDEAKTVCSWIDPDTLFVATDRGPGSLTESGYPRTVVRWSRGTRLADAVEVHAGRDADLMVTGWRDHTSGLDLIQVRPGFFTEYLIVLTDKGKVTLHAPEDAELSVRHGWLLIRLRTPWTVGGRTYREGSLLAERIDVSAGISRDLVVVYEPDDRSALVSSHWTRHHLLVVLLEDVRTRIDICTPGADPGSGAGGRPSSGSIAIPDWCSADIISTDPYGTDEYILAVDGFLQPPSVLRGVIGEEHGEDGGLETLKSAPAFFDVGGLQVEQATATSADGTLVPYFVVGRADRAGPTLVTGYGGFEISRLPSYNASLGRAWLARGGTYVLANIRGGGEFGPHWHRAALKADRPRAYEDFAAVATDLVRQGITTPARLGALGGSNGGLLMGNMLTEYGDLFGAVVAKVPLFDMRRYHRLLAGASWMAEYGDPDDPDQWAYIQRFSPYHRLEPGRPYPALLVTTSTRDDRVHPAHARKFVARMRELGYAPMYYENVEGGHAGAADNAQVAFLDALGYAFLWQTIGGAGAGLKQPAADSGTRNVGAPPSGLLS